MNKQTIFGAILAITITFSYIIFFTGVSGTTVTISSKEFTCTDAEPIGITSRCVNYHRAGR